MNTSVKKLVMQALVDLQSRRSLGYRYLKAGMPHRSTYQKVINDELSNLIFIHWHSYNDKFCFEVGWMYRSTLDDISSALDPKTAIAKNAAIVDVAMITGGIQEWHAVRADTLEKVVVPVFDSLLRIGIPYLETVNSAKLAGLNN